MRNNEIASVHSVYSLQSIKKQIQSWTPQTMPSLAILALQDSSSTEVTGTLVSVDPAPAQVFVNTQLMLRTQLLSPPASLHINCLEVSSESSNLQKQYRPNFQAGMFKYISLYTQKMLLKQMLSSGNGWDLLCKGALCELFPASLALILTSHITKGCGLLLSLVTTEPWKLFCLKNPLKSAKDVKRS